MQRHKKETGRKFIESVTLETSVIEALNIMAKERRFYMSRESKSKSAKQIYNLIYRLYVNHTDTYPVWPL